MRIDDLPIPDALAARYRARGIETLYPAQAQAVEAGLHDGASVVAAVPTAAGKTLIAELAMAAAVARGGRAIYVVPLRALAAEKAETFAALPDADVGVATGDYHASPEELADHDVVVATSEKVDSLIRSGADWLADVSCVVVDEIHLLGDATRGPTLEVTLAKLRRLRPGAQLVGLSATIANAASVADWLDAALVRSDWRPVDLRVGAVDDGRVVFADGTGRRLLGPPDDPVAAIVGETVSEDAQCLVFVRSRRAAEALAADLGPIGFGGPAAVADAIADSARTGTGGRLAACIRDGAAFHHAGLRADHRRLVEGAFRDGDLPVICATPTLAAGVNVPARRVLVRDLHRYTAAGREPLSTVEVAQMCGRAGRPGLDPEGEAVLVGDGATARERLDRYVRSGPEPVASSLADPDALRAHVLSTVASGFADDRTGVLSLLDETFYAHGADPGGLVDVVDLVLDDLEREGLLETGDGLRATPFGSHVSRLYVDPRTGAQLRDGLRAASDRRTVTAVTVLELVCATPDVSPLYLRSSDRAHVYRFAEGHADELLPSLEDFEGDFEAWLADVKTAAVCYEWAADVPEASIAERYGVGPGDIRSTLERVGWLLGAASSLAELLDAADDVRDALDRTLEAVREREA